MANNRMYLVNKRTGVKIYLAKYYPSTGWRVTNTDLGKTMNDGFDKSDWSHLTPEQRRKHELDCMWPFWEAKGTPQPTPPFYAANYPKEFLMWGDEWELEYEIDSAPPKAMAQSEEQ